MVSLSLSSDRTLVCVCEDRSRTPDTLIIIEEATASSASMLATPMNGGGRQDKSACISTTKVCFSSTLGLLHDSNHDGVGRFFVGNS